jgi:hypothetical protein
MSRSNNVNIQNPATRRFRWSGKHGVVTYYDKEAGEPREDGTPSGATFDAPLPFRFLVLENMSMIGGGEKRNKIWTPYWSNQVIAKELHHSVFTVRSSHGVEHVGSYKECKESVKGSKFVTMLYIGWMNGSEMEIGTLEIAGGCLSAWIDFVKKVDLFDGGFVITGATEEQNGDTIYFVPVFERLQVPEKLDEAAKALDKQLLSPYLAAYAANNTLDAMVEADAETDVHGQIEDSVNDWTGPAQPATREAFVAQAVAAATAPAPEPSPETPPAPKGRAKAKAAGAAPVVDDTPPFFTEPGDDDPWG